MKAKVGRTPRSAWVPLDPLFLQQADEGVGCGPGGPPHLRLQRSDHGPAGPPKLMKTKVGRTPRSARVTLDPLFLQQADEGVGCGPGGPPHLRQQRKVTPAAVVVALPRGRGSVRPASACIRFCEEIRGAIPHRNPSQRLWET